VLIGTKEAAERLGVSVRRVQQMIMDGALPATKIGRDYAILEKDLKNARTYGKPGRPPKGSK
jgi:excisionase family DNA binding protein